MNLRLNSSEEKLTYQVLFIVNFLLIILAMKYASWSLSHQKGEKLSKRFLFGTPLLSYSAFRLTPKKYIPLWFLILKFTLVTSAMGALLFVAHHLKAKPTFTDVLLLSPLIYLLTEWLGVFAQILFYSTVKLQPLHNHPLSSQSLGEFWGRRWNIWVQDWLRDMSRSQRRSLRKKLSVTFILSGLFHELMVNLPMLVFSGEWHFGNMMAYFMLQGAALWVDKKYLSQAPSKVRRIYLWLAVGLPAPLFLNRSLLFFFGIK